MSNQGPGGQVPGKQDPGDQAQGQSGELPDQLTNRSLGKSSLIMTAGTISSRLLGLVKNSLLVAAIGATGPIADSFAVANKLPTVLYGIIAGGTINAILVPQVVAAFKRRNGERYINQLISAGIIFSALLTVVLTLATPLLISLYTSTITDEQRAMAVAFGFWCMPQVFFYAVYALLGQVLNARGSFGPYMWAPALNNVVAIGSIVVYLLLWQQITQGSTNPADWSGAQIAVIGGGATLGIIAQALILLIPLRTNGIKLRFTMKLRGAGLTSVGNFAGWTVAGLAAAQVGMIFVSRLASSAPANAAGTTEAEVIAGNQAWDLSFLIFNLPHSLFTVSIMTALFTRLARHVAHKQVDEVRRDYTLGLRLIALVTFPSSVALLVLSQPAVRLLLPAATPAEVYAIGMVVSCFALALVPFGVWSMGQRIYFAHSDARSLFFINVAMSLVMLGSLGLIRTALEPAMWVAGAALSFVLSNVVGAAWTMFGIHRRLGGYPVLRTAQLYTRLLIISVVMAGVGLLTMPLVRDLSENALLSALIEAGITSSVMILVFLIGLRLMRVSELRDLISTVLRRKP